MLKVNTTLTSLNLECENESEWKKKKEKEWWITGCAIGDEGVKAISETLKVNTTLMNLYLESEEKENRKRKREKERNMNVRQWNWSWRSKGTVWNAESKQNFDITGSGRWARKKKQDEKKKEGWITDDKIGDEGAKAMSEMLKVNKSLKELNLEGVEERKA